MILLIDNYDSFSYNLYQLVGSIDPDIRVERNDTLNIDDIRQLKPSHIILSPGPGRPADAGICEDVVRALAGEIPILGVCLGHQAICEALGGEVSYAKQLMHGKQSIARLDPDCPLFRDCPPEAPVARYHSLAADPAKPATAILLPDFAKADLFKGVVLGGVLPRKTFSMGHAEEKRYYNECRVIGL